MATVSLRCKSCDGVLEINDDREILFCPYCGSKELFDDSDYIKAERIKSKAWRDIEHTWAKASVDTATIQSHERINARQAELREKISDNRVVVATIVFLAACLLLFTIGALLDSHETRTGARLTFSASQCKGCEYLEVQEWFTSLGFINIDCRPLEDLKMGVFAKEYLVADVRINGDPSFKKDDFFLWMLWLLYIIIHIQSRQRKKIQNRLNEMFESRS